MLPNMQRITVTLDVLNPLTSTVDSPVAQNMAYMLVTFEVINFEVFILRVFKLWLSPNIYPIFVTFGV